MPLLHHDLARLPPLVLAERDLRVPTGIPTFPHRFLAERLQLQVWLLGSPLLLVWRVDPPPLQPLLPLQVLCKAAVLAQAWMVA